MKRLPPALALGVVLAFLVAGCDSTLSSPEVPSDGIATGHQADARGIIPGRANVVDVIAKHEGGEHLFELSTDEIPSGWTTFRFDNASHSEHFFLLYEVPEEAKEAAEDAGKPLFEYWHEAIAEPFQAEFNPFIQGDIDFETFVGNLFGALGASAPWFLDPGAPPVGGPGLTAAGETSETTINLAPGTYMAECYVKDENEEFHSFNGMLAQLTVTEEESGAREPRATLEITVSQPGEGGIEIHGNARPGLHTVAIRFGSQPVFGYEHLLGHNAHLVRLDDKDDETLLDDLATWMDWTQPGALVSRSPEGTELLGGAMEMPGGETAYYTVNLKPGDYAWIAEVPDPNGKDMLKTFTVPFGRATGR